MDEEFGTFLGVLALAFILISLWLWEDKRQQKRESIRDQRDLLRNMFDCLRLKVEMVYPGEEETEILINGQRYTSGDGIMMRPEEEEDGYEYYRDCGTPFVIHNVEAPDHGSAEWKVVIVDYQTYGRLFSGTLSFDETKIRQETLAAFRGLKLQHVICDNVDTEPSVIINGATYKPGDTISGTPLCVSDISWYKERDTRVWEVSIDDEETSGGYFSEIVDLPEGRRGRM